MTSAPLPPSWMRLAVAGSGLLLLASAGLFYWATQQGSAQSAAGMVHVEVGAQSCRPADLTLPAGRTVFEILNTSDRPIEWEILDGPMVVEERENILPGLRSTLTAKLKPGQYQITCGLLSNPRGTLTVIATAASEAERAVPPVTAFIGPLSEYKVFLAGQSSALEKQLAALDKAIGANDLVAARQAWQAARLPYRRIEPLAMRFAELEARIDPLPDYLAAREQDPGFTGFHRLEFALWGGGIDAALAPIASALGKDAAELKAALRGVKLAPADLAGLPARRAQQMADALASEPENRWAGSDPAELAASLDALSKPLGLLMPVLAEAAPGPAAELRQAMENVAAAAASPPPEGQPDTALADGLRALAVAAAAANTALGLE